MADSNPDNLLLQIDILIGADHYWDFMLKKVVRGDSGSVAISSNLGFILSGAVNVPSHSNIVSSRLLLEESNVINTISQNVKNVLGFENLIKFENGHYEVELPFKEEKEILGDNYNVARGRLKSLYLNTFKNNPKLFSYYDKIIREQKNIGILENANLTNESVGSVCYRPHKPVIRDDKSTKVRIVSDASSCSKRERCLSLNDCLFSGPSLTPPLFDVLLRFTAYNYVLIADIEKASLQINLCPKQRDFVRFLWFNTSTIWIAWILTTLSW